jgi:hypothetical protein
MLKSSPSNIPQNKDTISREYVTEDAKTAVDICTNLLNRTFASAVPKADSTST